MPMLIMENSKEHSLAASDDSDEEEEISEDAPSPRINVTDNDEKKKKEVEDDSDEGASEKGHPLGECNRAKATSATDSGMDISLNAHLLACLGALPESANAQVDLGDLKQLESDKKAVYSHPLFPLLALLFEKCEMATRSINSFDSDPTLSAFNNEIEEFIEHQQRLARPFFTDNPEVDSLMIRSIQVFRIHLLELEKVSELCKDFCHRYISCLRSKMRSDVLLRGSSSGSSGQTTKAEEGELDVGTQPHLDLSSTFLSSSMSSSLSSTSPSPSSMSCSSPSRSINCSPPSSPSLSTSSVRSSQQHHHLPSYQPTDLPNLCRAKSPSPSFVALNFDQVIKPYLRLPNAKYNLFNGTLLEHSSSTPSPPLDDDNMVAHDLTIKKSTNHTLNNTSKTVITKPDNLVTNNIRKIEDITENVRKSPTKMKKSGEKTGSHSKRGVLPKQATSIMRSWLFQHIVHPYPTEDEKRAIASQTNLTLLQVNNWFINARRRILQPMLDSANTIHHDLVTGNVTELDLSSKNKAIPNGSHTKKLKTNSQPLNRFWPQSLANIIQTNDLTSK